MTSHQPTTSQEPRNPASTLRGRGGAGNISNSPAVPVEANDLSTPTIKSATYTTGRGGQGNMAANDPADPSTARAAQDVEAPAHHDRKPQGTFHWGRGGEGNMLTLGGKNGDKADRKDARSRSRDVGGKYDEKSKAAAPTSTTLGDAGEARLVEEKPPRRPSFKDGEKGQRRGSFKEAVKEKLGLGHQVKAGKGKTEADSLGESAIDD